MCCPLLSASTTQFYYLDLLILSVKLTIKMEINWEKATPLTIARIKYLIIYDESSRAVSCPSKIVNKDCFMLANVPHGESWILSQHFWCILGSSLLYLRAKISFCLKTLLAVSERRVQTTKTQQSIKTNEIFKWSNYTFHSTLKWPERFRVSRGLQVRFLLLATRGMPVTQ